MAWAYRFAARSEPNESSHSAFRNVNAASGAKPI